MPHTAQKLGIILSGQPDRPGFEHGLRLATAALARGGEVYIYCLDDATTGVSHTRLQELKARGLKLFACAHGAQKRGIAFTDQAVFCGVTMLGEIMRGADRLVSFG